MIWVWIWVGGMITFLVPTARLLTGGLDDDDDILDVAPMIALAICAVPFWPLFIPGYYVYWMLKHGQRD